MEIIKNILTNNDCYKTGRRLNIKRLMVHSTAVPGAPAKNFVNSWNVSKPGGREVCVHGFIDSVSAYQTLPWDMQAWHCGGSGNQQAIGIELCEPKDYSNKTEGMKTINNAVKVYAYLCKMFGISPSNIVSHKEGHAMGIASNHGDPDHWWKHIGYTMDNFRADVQKAINNSTAKAESPDGEVNDKVGTMQNMTDQKGKISYQVHARKSGWLSWKCDGQLAGSTGQSRRIEALKIKYDGKLDVMVHMKGIGDKLFKDINENTVIGTVNEQRRIEALKLISNEKLAYRVHQKSYGWSDWKYSGEYAGVTGKSKQVEALEIKKPKLVVRGHVQDIGWQKWVPDGCVVGTTGKGYRMEALQIDPCGHKIKAKVHMQNDGWVDYGEVTADKVLGTTGQSKRIECLCFEGDFEYRVHIQNSGWTNWTKADGVSTLGTVGQALRIEAFETR